MLIYICFLREFWKKVYEFLKFYIYFKYFKGIKSIYLFKFFNNCGSLKWKMFIFFSLFIWNNNLDLFELKRKFVIFKVFYFMGDKFFFIFK